MLRLVGGRLARTHNRVAAVRLQRPVVVSATTTVRRAMSAGAGAGAGAGGSGANKGDAVAAALAAAEAAQRSAAAQPHFTFGSADGSRDGYSGGGSYRGSVGGGYRGSRGGGDWRGRGRGGPPRSYRLAERRVPGMAVKLYENATAARAARDGVRVRQTWDSKRESIEAFVERNIPSKMPADQATELLVVFDPTSADATVALDTQFDALPRAAYTESQLRVAHAQMRPGAAADPTPYSAVDSQWRATCEALDARLLDASVGDLIADATARLMAVCKATNFVDGKWLFFLPPDFSGDELDALWQALALATARGCLGTAMRLLRSPKPVISSSTSVGASGNALPAPGLEYMIEVWTPDFQSQADVFRVRDAIKHLCERSLLPLKTLKALERADADEAAASAAAAGSTPAAAGSANAQANATAPAGRGQRKSSFVLDNTARLLYKPRIMSFLGVYRDHPYHLRPTTAEAKLVFGA